MYYAVYPTIIPTIKASNASPLAIPFQEIRVLVIQSLNREYTLQE